MEQNEVWIVVGLFSVSLPLIALARRVNVPYPIVLVIGGLILGFIPGLPTVSLDPNLVLVIFLPPLLYWEGVTAPVDVIRANYGQIWVLAIGLVIATTTIVAAVAHSLIAGMSWAMAFVLGAIVAPTDELASAPVLERLGLPRHLIAIVEGESLLNDASSLILYAAAVAVVVGGAFNFGSAALEFVIAAVGGVIVGVVVARLAVEGWRRMPEPELQGIVSITAPYLAFSLAGRFGLSSVLATVYTAFVINRFSPRVLTPSARLRGTGFWDLFVLLLNVVLFLMLGMQLHSIAQAVFKEYPPITVAWYALVVNLAVIGVRFAWLLGQEYLPVIGAATEHPSGDWKHALIAGWSGLRGAVSLAAALALPLTTSAGNLLPLRNLVIFLTFSVILVTLVLGGLTLPWIIGLLDVPDAPAEEDKELRRAELGMSKAALLELQTIEAEGNVAPEDLRRFRRRYEHRRKHVDGHPDEEIVVIETERRLIDAERRALIDMRDRGEIDNTVLRRLQHNLDMAEERLGALPGT